MNRTLIALILILWCAAGSIQATTSTKTTIIPLPDLAKPELFLTDGTQFYITDDASFYIYRWQDCSLLKKVGSRGQGPQEFDISSYSSANIMVHEDKIYGCTPTKIMEYKKDGTFIKETRTFLPVNEAYSGRLYKIGNFYIRDTLCPDQSKGILLCFYLTDARFNKLIELKQFKFPIDLFNKKWYIYSQIIAPRFYKNMAFIATGDTFEITGINDQGKIFLNLNYPYKRLEVTKDDIQKYHHYFKTEHSNRSSYEKLKKWFRFPDYFPAIKEFQVNNNRIYVQTYRKNQKNESQFLIFDLTGKYLQTIWLPVLPSSFEGDYSFVFNNNQFVQLVDNPDEETWELHIMPLPKE